MCTRHVIDGQGHFHFLLVPGVVPDGPETFLRQTSLLRRFGSLTIFTYPYEDFSLDAVLEDLRSELERVRALGRQPVLMGVSVGGGICLELLRRAREADAPLELSACILVSPFTCARDLAPLLARLVDGIVADQAPDGSGNRGQALERGRTFFRALANRTAAKTAPRGWRSLFALLTPQGLADLAEQRIRERIDRTLASIPPHGAVARVTALTEMPGINAGERNRRPLCTAPTLILWGSKERHTLDMDGPGTGILCRPDLASRHFPDCEVHWIYASDGEDVPHASLIKHAQAFNRPLRQFLARHARAEETRHPRSVFARGMPFIPFLAARQS